MVELMLKLKIMKMILITIVIKKYNIVTDSNSENNFNGTEYYNNDDDNDYKIYNNDRRKFNYRFSNTFKNGYNINEFNENNDYVTYNKENDN